MADTKISALTAASAAAGTNELPINESGTSKKLTVTQIETYLRTRGLPRVIALTGDAGANSTTTMAKITGLDMTLGAGTYTFKYMIRYQSALSTTGVKFAVTHSGTVTTFQANHYFAQELSTAASLAADQATTAAAVGLMSAIASRAVNQVAGPTASSDTGASDMLWIVEGTMIVTVSGDLQLNHASEVAAASTVKAGSSLMVVQVA